MTLIERFEKETRLEYSEYLEETGYLVPIEYAKWLEKKINKHKSKTIVIDKRHTNEGVFSYTVETNDGCVEKLANDLEKSKDKIQDLKIETAITINNIKNMNYWSFRKWKKTK